MFHCVLLCFDIEAVSPGVAQAAGVSSFSSAIGLATDNSVMSDCSILSVLSLPLFSTCINKQLIDQLNVDLLNVFSNFLKRQ